MTAAGKRLIAAAKEARSQAELLAQIAILEKRVEEWRQDAAARLKTWMALAKSGLIGEPIQVRVSLIMPTYAMLNGDETGSSMNQLTTMANLFPRTRATCRRFFKRRASISRTGGISVPFDSEFR